MFFILGISQAKVKTLNLCQPYSAGKIDPVTSCLRWRRSFFPLDVSVVNNLWFAISRTTRVYIGMQYTPIVSLQRGKTLPMCVLGPSRLGLQNTPTEFLQMGKTLPTSVLRLSRLGLQRGKTLPMCVLRPSRLGLQNTPPNECLVITVNNLRVRHQ